jgi:hypothetical protein
MFCALDDLHEQGGTAEHLSFLVPSVALDHRATA